MTRLLCAVECDPALTSALAKAIVRGYDYLALRAALMSVEGRVIGRCETQFNGT